MLLSLAFWFTVVAAGFGALRVLGLARGAVGLGLMPAAGVGILALISSWSMLVDSPPPLPAVVLMACAGLGLLLALHDHRSLGLAWRRLVRKQRLETALLFTGLAVPFITMGFAFGRASVPLSPHDGAYHVEAIQAFRLGRGWSDWYPPGLAALFAAWLQAFPWVDSAEGAFDLGLSVPSLAGLAVFGLTAAVWHEVRIASVAPLLLCFTYVYPYFPQLWSGWPLALSLVLVIGTWTASLEYVRRPSRRWAVLFGLMLSGVLLVHGTELYTVALIFVAVSAAAVRLLPWRELRHDVPIAALVMLVGAAPYLPTLLHWAAGGGAYAVGFADAESGSTAGASVAPSVSNSLVVFALGALGVDLPVRLVLLGVGAAWIFQQRRGRSVVALAGVFVTGAAIFSLLSGVALIRQIYASVFPWGMHYRLFMVVAIAQSLIAAAGGVAALRWVRASTSRQSPHWARRLGRLGRIALVTWVGLMVWATVALLAYPARLVLGYGVDDAAAMGWLRQNGAPGSMVVNDGYADGGIWAPYKSGLPVLLPRSASADELRAGRLVIDNVARLDQVPEARAVACARDVGYVYRGARVSEWDRRRFPALSELRASPALEEAFASGEAVVFRLRLAC